MLLIAPCSCISHVIPSGYHTAPSFSSLLLPHGSLPPTCSSIIAIPSQLTSLPHSPAPQNQPTSCRLITYRVTLLHEEHTGECTKCKALGLDKPTWPKNFPDLPFLLHSPPHTCTASHIPPKGDLLQHSKSHSPSYFLLCPLPTPPPSNL